MWTTGHTQVLINSIDQNDHYKSVTSQILNDCKCALIPYTGQIILTKTEPMPLPVSKHHSLNHLARERRHRQYGYYVQYSVFNSKCNVCTIGTEQITMSLHNY
jgi:hypothetical protein